MNCEIFQNEIENATLNSETLKHLQSCAECRQTAKLREVLADLEKVSAPANFDFQLKARWRKENQKSALPSFGFAPKAVVYSFSALVICLFSLWFALNVLNFSPNAPSQVSSNPPISNKVSPTIQVKTATTSSSPENNLIKPDEADNSRKDETAQAKTSLPKKLIAPKLAIALKPSAKRSPTKRAEMPPVNLRDEEILRRDVTVTNAPKSKTPKGIPDPLNKQGTNAENWLEGFGMKTSAEGENLRVVSVSGTAESSGLQKDDIIEKFNGKTPREISTNNLPEIILTVRRDGKTQEIKLKIKSETVPPQNQ